MENNPVPFLRQTAGLLHEVAALLDNVTPCSAIESYLHCRYDRSYDLAFVQRRFAGKRFIALNILWHYKEQASFPVCLCSFLNLLLSGVSQCCIAPGNPGIGQFACGQAIKTLYSMQIHDRASIGIQVTSWSYGLQQHIPDLVSKVKHASPFVVKSFSQVFS